MAIVQTKIAEFPTAQREFRLHRKGWKVIPQSRTKYSEVYIKTAVPDLEEHQWVVFFACVATVSAMVVALVAGPITWGFVVATILVVAPFCFSAVVTPDKLKSQSGEAFTNDRWGSWG